MEEKMYSIKLSNGTVISDLRMNGNNFISDIPIDPGIFEGNTDTVIVSDGETEEIRHHAKFIQTTAVTPGISWLLVMNKANMNMEKLL